MKMKGGWKLDVCVLHDKKRVRVSECVQLKTWIRGGSIRLPVWSQDLQAAEKLTL